MNLWKTIRFNSVFIIVTIGFAQYAQTADLLCYDRSLEDPQVTPLESPLPLIEASCIQTDRDTVIFVYGYNANAASMVTVKVLSAYITYNATNLVLLDWPHEASSGNLGGYNRAVLNTELVGNQLAKALKAMAEAGLNLKKVHLVGHSLGAQICGIAGNTLKTLKLSVARITGLDPARPLYEGSVSVPNALNEGSAVFVDIVHSDPGTYGIKEEAGTVDFWPNFYGYPHFQPGCPKEDYPVFVKSQCSHKRSWMFFVESILNRKAFPASGNPDYETWLRKNGTTNNIAYMGQYVSLKARGNFYLATNAKAPYSKGCAGIRPTPEINC